MRSLQFGLVVTAIVTSLAGILSNPLFALTNSAVAQTPILQQLSLTASQDTGMPKAAALTPVVDADRKS